MAERLQKLNSDEHRSKYAPTGLWLSNCQRIKRKEYLTRLLAKIKVDSYGGCPYRSEKLPSSKGSKQFDTDGKVKLIPNYKFHLGFEGSVTNGYVSEKFFDHWRTPSLLVYYGDPNIEHIAPGKHSFVNVHNFGSPEKLGEYLNYLDKNDTAYSEYFKWRPAQPTVSDLTEGFVQTLRQNFVNRDKDSIPCRICTAIETGRF
jgi:hypothetical protein